MKTLFTFLFFILLPIFIFSQQFQWAKTYDIENANEVAAIAADADSNLIIAGIYNAPTTLPFKGKAFLVKTDKTGSIIWEESINGQVIIGDMATVGNNILIVGQSWSNFVYRGEPYGQGQYFMFTIMLDGDGNHLWHFTDETRWGANANISVGNNGLIALHINGAGNLRDWIMIIDQEGNQIKGRQISSTFNLVSDIVYYNDKLYFNGGFNGPGTVTVDTILIERPPTQNASITMCFSEDLVAEWLFVDETFSNNVGQIVANENGLYLYEPVVVNGFTARNSLKQLSFDGQLIQDIDPLFFSSIAVFRVSMVATPSHIALFTRNFFNGVSHIVLLYDHELNLETSKIISGGMQTFVPGHMTSLGDNLFVAQVHNVDVDFDGTILIPFTSASQNFYVAELSSSAITGIADEMANEADFAVFPNPASNILTIQNSSDKIEKLNFEVVDAFGKKLITNQLISGNNAVDIGELPSGLYFIRVFGAADQQQVFTTKLIKR